MTTEIRNTKISDLKPMEDKFRLLFKVTKKSEKKEVKSKKNELETDRVCDITVSDDTGSIILSAWNEDIELLEQGKFFKIENGYVNLYQHSLRLERGKFGTFEPIEEGFKINESNNRSEEVYDQPKRKNIFTVQRTQY